MIARIVELSVRHRGLVLVAALALLLAGLWGYRNIRLDAIPDLSDVQVIVVTDPRQWDFFTDLIEKLDQKSDPNTRNDVIYLKHAKASDVVAVLTKIITGQNQALQKQGSTNQRPQTPTATAPATPTTPRASSSGATSGLNPG